MVLVLFKRKEEVSSEPGPNGEEASSTWYVPGSSISLMYKYGGPRFGDSQQLQHPKFSIDPAMSRGLEDCFPISTRLTRHWRVYPTISQFLSDFPMGFPTHLPCSDYRNDPTQESPVSTLPHRHGRTCCWRGAPLGSEGAMCFQYVQCIPILCVCRYTY